MTAIRSDVTVPQPIPTHGSGPDDKPATPAPSGNALPWDRNDGTISPTIDVSRRHSVAGTFIGLGAGLFAGGAGVGMVDEMSYAGASDGAMASGFLIPFVGLGVLGFALGRWVFDSKKSVDNPHYDAAKARTVAVQALEGHALVQHSQDIDWAAQQSGKLAHPLEEYVVDKVVSSSTDRLTAARSLYDKGTVQAMVGHGDIARALVQVAPTGTSDDATWAVVDMHRDAAAAAKSRYEHPKSGAFSGWRDPLVDAVLTHVASDKDTEVTENGERWQVTRHRDDVAVLNGRVVAGSDRASVDVLAAGAPTDSARVYLGRA